MRPINMTPHVVQRRREALAKYYAEKDFNEPGDFELMLAPVEQPPVVPRGERSFAPRRGRGFISRLLRLLAP